MADHSNQDSKVSDQMPEEAPAEQVPDDVPAADEGAARESGRRHAREVSGHPNPSTGPGSPAERGRDATGAPRESGADHSG